MMRYFVRFELQERIVSGEVKGSLVELLSGSIFDGTLAPTGETVELAAIDRFLPPVADIPNLFAVGKNYIDHCREFGSEPPKTPLFFLKATSALTAHNCEIVLPRLNPAEVDFEAELAIVIGKRASDISEAEAPDYILGYTCANDVSARDVQLRIDSQWARGKSFDTFAPLGPFLVTGVDAPERLRVQMFLNGEKMQDQPVSDMSFSIPRIVSYLSQGVTLLPGTVILTGTPSGVGMGRTPKRFLKSGDVTEVVIDGIGTLRNRVR